MLQFRTRAALEQRGRGDARDAGFSLVELLVVVIVVGLLSALAIPAYRDQQRKSLNSTVTSDLGRYGTAAERLFAATYAYPDTTTGFNLRDQGDPDASAGNTFRAFTVATGAESGYVIYGQNTTTQAVYVLSSYAGGKPVLTALTALPTVPPVAGTLGVLPTIVATDWTSLPGLTWGAVKDTTGTSSPRIPFYDPTFLLAAVGGTAANVGAYVGGSHRVVAVESPVASRAIEISTVGVNQGVIFFQQPAAASWPGASPITAANETWTASAWVKAPAGITMRLGPRITGSDGSYVTENAYSFNATGNWQRASFTVTLGATMIGKYIGVEVFSPAAGVTFDVTGAQVNMGPVATPFSLS